MANPSAFDPRHLLYKACLWKDQLLPTNASITYAGRKDGIGAQIHSVLSLAAFAKLRGLKFIEQPLQEIAHNYDEEVNWDEQWNRFFGLPLKHTPMDQTPTVLRQVTRRLNLRRNHSYEATKAHRFVDYFPSIYEEIMPSYRARYEASDISKDSLFSQHQGILKLAFHLRRGDVIAERPGRVSSIEDAKAKLGKLRNHLDTSKRAYEILVFSQGAPADFKLLEGSNTRVLLNSNLFATFHSMVTADVLLTARSALSYAAGLYSTNTVIYERHYHPPMPHWLRQIDYLSSRLPEP